MTRIKGHAAINGHARTVAVIAGAAIAALGLGTGAAVASSHSVHQRRHAGVSTGLQAWVPGTPPEPLNGQPAAPVPAPTAGSYLSHASKTRR
jgi:hypothetical protein